MSAFDRRSFLLGAVGVAGAGGLLAACSDDATSDDATSEQNGADSGGPTPTTPEPLATPALVPSFSDGLRGPSPFVHSVEQRLAYVLHDGNDIMRSDAPASIMLEIFDEADALIAGGEAVRRDTGVPTPYYSVFFTPPAAGTYRTVFTNDAGTYEHPFLVLEPGQTSIPQPGDPLPSVHTATIADARGVDPLCTRAEPCPFHETDLTDALAAGDQPTVLSIATPGFCQTEICGPVIELLIDEVADRSDVHVVHAEVYADPHNDEGLADGTGADTTDIVEAYTLTYEPVLFVADADGIILRRLDAVYDGSELAEALALV